MFPIGTEAICYYDKIVHMCETPRVTVVHSYRQKLFNPNHKLTCVSLSDKA